MKRVLFILLFIPVVMVLSGCTLNRQEEAAPADTSATAVATVVQPPADESVLDDSARVLVAPTGPAAKPGEVLIKFAPEVTPKLPTEKKSGPQAFSIGEPGLDSTMAELGITGLEPLLAPIAQATGQTFESLSAKTGTSGEIYIATFDPAKDVNAIVAALAQNAVVEYTEPNYFAYAAESPAVAPVNFTPNDPFAGYQWNMTTIQMPQAWDVSTGEGVIVAVLDTGIAYETDSTFVQAPDLAGTTFVPGYDFINNDAHPNDDNGHGTHVAGTIAQTTNNNEGVTGIAYKAKLMPVKVLNNAGQGSYSSISQGIHFAVQNGARIINLSLTGYSGSQVLADAVNYARANGVMVVAAAGNNNSAVGYPAKYDGVVAVGAVRFDETRAPYSNVGPEIDLVAPGGDNTVDQNGDGFGDGIVQQTFKSTEINTFRYLFMEGTSMATPHISGAAAILAAKNPTLTAAELEAALFNSAKDLGAAGKDNEYGAGLLQVCNALAAIGAPCNQQPPLATPTSAPTGETPVPPTSTPPPVATPTPSPVGDIIINGSFETDEAWVFKWTASQGRITTDRARSGSRSALVGITDPNLDYFSYSSAAQKITIPADTRKATLAAYLFPVSQDIPSGDAQLVMVLDVNFRVIDELWRGLSNDQTWQAKTFDLTPYAGQTIYVYFGAVNNRSNGKGTALYIDDVSVVLEK